MSGVDSNPFGDQEPNNPFADPAVMQATRSAAGQKGLDDYNPFANEGGAKMSVGRGAANPPQYQPPMSQTPYSSTSQPAVMQPTPEPPPAYTPSAQQKITTDELQRRQEELERKAAELQRKEEALRNASYNVQKNNWPPLPEKFCVGPCFYQDINLEIPLEFQKLVRTMYYLWMFHTCVMLLNVLGGLALLVTDGGATTFGLSLMFLFLFTPISYLCWFRPVYKAFKSDSSFNFFVFFFIFFFQCIVTGLFAVGIPGMGSCGWVEAIKADNMGAKILCMIAATGFTLLTVWCAFMLYKVHRLYRSTGASFAKAQQEFASGVLRNEHVQNAAANAASSAIRQQMAAGDNRY